MTNFRLCFSFACGLAISTTNATAQLQFEDVTTAMGFVYSGESWGASWGNLDGNPWPDLFVNNHRNRPSVFRNDGPDGFADVTSVVDDSGIWTLKPNDDTHGGTWSDFDNDGDQDLYITSGANDLNQFLVNEGGVLVDRTLDYDPLTPGWRARLPVWLDYTDDGLLDFVMASESSVDIFEQLLPGPGFHKATSEARLQCSGSQSAQLADVNNDDRLELICIDFTLPVRIYQTGAVPFTDITGIMPKTNQVQELAAADLDNDLAVDFFAVRGAKRLSGAAQIAENAIEAQLISPFSTEKGFQFDAEGQITVYLATDYKLQSNLIHIGANGWSPNESIVNKREITFTLSPDNPDNAGIQNHNPRADLGIYIGYDANTASWQVYHSPGGDWRYAYLKVESEGPLSNVSARGLTNDDLPTPPRLLRNQAGAFVDHTLEAGLSQAVSCISTVAGDFDNDMDVDLYLVCRGAVANLANVLQENQGDGTFLPYPDAAGAAGNVGYGVGKGESVVVADFDVDGFLDLFVTNGLQMVPGPPNDIGGPYNLFRNLGNGNHWIEIDLIGVTSNRDGIGAKVYAMAGGVTQLREQNGGYHRWSQNHQRIHFGLAQHTTVDVEVRWPSGVVDNYTDLPVDQVHALQESTLGNAYTLGAAGQSVDEGMGPALFTVNLSPAPGAGEQVQVSYQTRNGSALAGSDYTTTSGTLTFGPGQTQHSISVPITGDADPEGNETFSLELTSPDTNTAMATATILDDDGGGTEPLCGTPSYDKATESAVFLYNDCNTNNWHVRVSAGGQWLSYQGSLVSDRPFESLTAFSFESDDVLPAPDFTLNVGGSGHDGLDFGIQAGAEACFRLRLPVNVPVLAGSNRVAVGREVNLTDFGACNGSTPECGIPSYDKATETGTFLWNDCGTNLWHIRVTAGGLPVSYQGTLIADPDFDDMTTFAFEAGDAPPPDFVMNVGGPGEDGIDFGIPDGGTACFTQTSPALPVRAGPDRVVIDSAVRLPDFGSCTP